jgi:hypothetical protein
VLFTEGVDNNGNENDQLYLYDTKTGEDTLVTEAPDGSMADGSISK